MLACRLPSQLNAWVYDKVIGGDLLFSVILSSCIVLTCWNANWHVQQLRDEFQFSFFPVVHVCMYVCMYESRDRCTSLHFMCCWNHMIFFEFYVRYREIRYSEVCIYICMYVCMHDLPVLLSNQLKTDGSPQPLVVSVYLSAETVSNVCVSVWSRSM